MTADRKTVGTHTLLKHRQQIDNELATRQYLDVVTFKQVYSKCPTTSKREGWEKMGYNTAWDDFEYAPVKRLHCDTHNVKSERFVDLDAYMAGEIGTSHS